MPIHETIKSNLLEAFIAKRDEYPTTCSDERSIQQPAVASKGTAFAQKGNKKGSGKKGVAATPKKEAEETKEETKKNWFENKECFVCGEKGHSAKKCPNKIKKNSDNTSASSKLSKF